MARNHRTISETLFEELCQQHSIPCRRLPVRADRPQPDYELELADNIVVAEVKQIDRNEGDRNFAEAFRLDGMATQCRNPDLMAGRVRNRIKKSRSQFKAYLNCQPQTPALLVLFDAAENKYTDPYTIQTALHGWEQVVVNIPSGGQPVTVADRGFAQRNNREVRPGKNEHLSALATLHECWDIKEPHDRFLALCFYHNSFAAHPVKPTWWSADHISHWKLDEKRLGEFQNWISVTGNSECDSTIGDE